jgi:hypothetical protein
LWRAAVHEHATPKGIGWSVGVGVFAGCTPAIGLHAGVAVVLATVFRLNRIWAVLGSRICFFLILPWIAFAEIQIAHRLRTGQWATIPRNDVLEHAREWIEDWFLGCVPVGALLGVGFGVLAYFLARRRDARLRRRTPAPAPPPSSGSPR